MVSLIGSVINPVKSCIKSGWFSPAGIYCFRLDVTHGFFYSNNDSFSDVILSDFDGIVFSLSGFSSVVDDSLHRVPLVKGLKSLYDPLI